jgi:hypothetical protein
MTLRRLISAVAMTSLISLLLPGCILMMATNKFRPRNVSPAELAQLSSDVTLIAMLTRVNVYIENFNFNSQKAPEFCGSWMHFGASAPHDDSVAKLVILEIPAGGYAFSTTALGMHGVSGNGVRSGYPAGQQGSFKIRKGERLFLGSFSYDGTMPTLTQLKRIEAHEAGLPSELSAHKFIAAHDFMLRTDEQVDPPLCAVF